MTGDGTTPGLPDDLITALANFTAAPRILVASDYDGCLSPLVSRPEDAVPNPASITALERIAQLPDTAAAAISGRERAVLAELSGLADTVILVGSHGSEFDSGFATEVTPAAHALLDRLIVELRSIAADYPGAMVETKPASTVLHVRNASPVDGAAALQRARAGVASWPGVHVTEGKAVLELAVIDTSKGYALDVLRERFGADAVLYLGDDVTDEKAFAHLHPPIDIGIKVGAGETIAAYRITDTDAVARVLGYVADHRAEAVADRR